MGESQKEGDASAAEQSGPALKRRAWLCFGLGGIGASDAELRGNRGGG